MSNIFDLMFDLLYQSRGKLLMQHNVLRAVPGYSRLDRLKVNKALYFKNLLNFISIHIKQNSYFCFEQMFLLEKFD